MGKLKQFTDKVWYGTGDSGILLTVHVAQPDEEALINHSGLTVPDFGAIFGIVPTYGNIRLIKKDTGYADGTFTYDYPEDVDPNELLAVYADWLAKFGFVFSHVSDDTEYTRTFYFHRQAANASASETDALSVTFRYQYIRTDPKTMEDYYELKTIAVEFRGRMIPPDLIPSAE